MHRARETRISNSIKCYMVFEKKKKFAVAQQKKNGNLAKEKLSESTRGGELAANRNVISDKLGIGYFTECQLTHKHHYTYYRHVSITKQITRAVRPCFCKPRRWALDN